MQPLNKAERSRAFTTFLILFLLTNALVIAAVFFGMSIPTKQNEKLRYDMSLCENERGFQKNFSTKMQETKRMLDSVNMAEVRADLVDSYITQRVQQMNAMVDSDTTITNKGLYQLVVQNYSDLQMAKRQLRQASSADANLQNSQRTIQELQTQLATANQTIDILRMQMSQR